MQDESARIDKLVSLTYDSNPDVRRQAARELSKIDDPRAVFAMLELGADKDPSVQDVARSSLDNFKGEERETLVSLEKIFEARQEGRPPPEDMAIAKQKLMPSLERLFSKNKAARDRLLPSIEKLFSWMPSGVSNTPKMPPPSQAQSAQSSQPAQVSVSPIPPPQSQPSLSSPPPTSRSSFEQVATAHISTEDKVRMTAEHSAQHSAQVAANAAAHAAANRAAQAPVPLQPEYADEPQDEPEDDAADDDSSDAVPASVPIDTHSHSRDPLSGVENIRSHQKNMLEQAEDEVGVPAHLRSPQDMRRQHSGAGQYAQNTGSSPAHAAADSSSMQQRMEDATNFPVPEYLQAKAPSPTSAIPSMTGDEKPELEFLEEEGVKMPRHALYYYKLAYAIAMTPGIKASEVKKEKERLVKESKADIELAFKLAMERTESEGIESLSGLKPGMKKLSTLPLEVLDNVVVSVPHGKKLVAYNRVLLSDGKHQLPLYVPPPRADGIRAGDLLSLRDAFVDYWVKANPVPGGQPGELVLMLGKNGQMSVTK